MVDWVCTIRHGHKLLGRMSLLRALVAHHLRDGRTWARESIRAHGWARHRPAMVGKGLAWCGRIHHSWHLWHRLHSWVSVHDGAAVGWLINHHLTTHGWALCNEAGLTKRNGLHVGAHAKGRNALLELRHMLRYLAICNKWRHSRPGRGMHARVGGRELHVMSVKVRSVGAVMRLHRRMTRSVLWSVDWTHDVSTLLQVRRKLMLVGNRSIVDGLRRRHWLYGNGSALKHVGIALLYILLWDVPSRRGSVRLRNTAVHGELLRLVLRLSLLLQALDRVEHVGK